MSMPNILEAKETYPVWKYTYSNGNIRKEVYTAGELDGKVYFYASDFNKGPNGSRKSISVEELDNPCTNNINQGVYLTEEDDEFAISHFQSCLKERIYNANKIIDKCEQEYDLLEILKADLHGKRS